MAASSQEASTSSSTCWTSGLDLLDTLDMSLFSDSFQMSPPPISNNSLHLALNPSGLFDNELAGIKPDPAATTFDLNTDFVDEVGGEPSLDKMGGDIMDVLTSFSDDVDDEYLNSFMDLTGFLQLEDSNLGKPEVSLKPEPEVIDEPEPEVIDEPVKTKSQKRKHGDVLSDEMGSFSASIDHDYVSKKSRTSSATEDDDVFEEPKAKVAPVQKYRERRVKNNIASRRSREIRKQKYANMEGEAERLIVDNAKLRERIEEMEQMAKEMKATLISKLAGK
ncbi:cell death specification protein 2-like [Mizuhopecten yessoensis]|nr:cell death specification protein 2-like [Mizuhopecten yessoensis]